MRRPRFALPVLLLAAASCGDGPSADEQAFCERLERLTTNDPFQAFGDRATSDEIEQAFTALAARADELVDVAPGEIRGPAKDYAEAAETLDDLLAAADYDGDQVALDDYRRAQVDYAEAAATLQRHLDNDC